MYSDRTSYRAFLVLLFGALAVLGVVFWPLAKALFLAGILAATLLPLHRRLSNRGKHRTFAAWCISFGVVVLMVGPLVAFSTFVAKEGAEGVRFVGETLQSEGVQGMISKLPRPLARAARKGLALVPLQNGKSLERVVADQVAQPDGTAVEAVKAAVTETANFMFHASMTVIALFFLLLEGERLLTYLERISPLKEGQTRELLAEFRRVSVAVLASSLITSAVQALAALVGYLLVRVQHPLFFAAVTFFFAFVPAIGAGSVCVLVAAFVFLSGHPGAGALLALWGVLVVALADNLIKPILIKNDIHMHGAIVFFSLLGGLMAFGALGLLIGPLAVSLAVAMLQMYQRDFGRVSAARP